MNTQSLFRYAGIAGLISIVAFFLAFALPAMLGEANSALVMVVYAVNLLTSLVPLFALYVIHRSEAPGLSLAAFVAATASSLRRAVEEVTFNEGMNVPFVKAGGCPRLEREATHPRAHVVVLAVFLWHRNGIGDK